MKLRESFFKGNYILFFITVILGIAGTMITLLYAYLLQELLDIANRGNMNDLKNILLFALALFIGLFVVQMLMKRVRCAFVRRAMIQYKNLTFKIISNKNITSFAKEKTSSYLSVLTNDATYIEENYLYSLFEIIMLLFSFIGAVALMLWYNWIMTIVVILSCAIPIMISLIFGNKMSKLEQSISSENESFMGVIKDLLGGFFVIKSFQADNKAIELFENQNSNLEKFKEKRKNTEGTITIISAEVGSILQIGIFVVGTILSIKDLITIGVVIAFVQLMNNIMEPIQQLPALFAKRKAAKSLVEKMENYSTSNETEDGSIDIENISQSIKFENVNFSYDDNKKALDNINIEFETGKSYVIVGESGSGKSTLFRLLLKGYSNYQGNIFFDNNNLKDIRNNSLYNVLSIVQQDVFIFNSSVRNNITLFNDYENDKVNQSIKLSGLEKFIEKKGLNFDVGENGVNLSGGERQRISIARCLLKDTKVLLVDEATSALDAETSYLIMNSILKLDDITRIFITHDLDKEMMKKFDEIIVLKEGRIIEKGKYDELISNKDYFYSLLNAGVL